ncbi:hypothetical protein CSOJ01_02293 [Colletotrichum sojae]|uniref:AB hydrolase-1 domain-containing protein n=1 Tax=Colletotrichum sojae TaxID=2175907 RepID=A0A8H6JRY5_9PEZI|nr:hypothetical protein CSOJ01_02293 [Colletotrichum sojae]
MTSQTEPPRSAFPDPKEYLDDPRFHQTFTLPPGPTRPHSFTVSYSDYGYRNKEHPELERVLLLCGPLLGSRYLHIAKDALAKHHRVRIIDVDRPGFGGTSGVPSPGDRVAAWLEIVPALLSHLGVRHVSVAAHSGGTIYALNVALRLRHLLHPERPYVALCAPWVRPARSGAPLMSLAGAVLPEGLVGGFDKVAAFVNRNIAPAVRVSGSLVPSLGGKAVLAPGVDGKMVEFEERLWGPLIDRVYSESVKGLGQDSVLLLKRDGKNGDWGGWEDYDDYVPMLAAEGVAAGKLRVEVFFAESDVMIGVGAGPKWIEECWRAEVRGDGIEFASRVVPGSDHDTIAHIRFGVFEEIFRGMSGEDDVETPPAAAAGMASVAAEQPAPLREGVAV